MNMPADMIVNSVEHRYAGNGWAVVAVYPQEWASVIYIGKGEVGNQAYSVWSKLLKSEGRPLEPKLMLKLDDIRKDLASGKKIIKDTRVVSV